MELQTDIEAVQQQMDEAVGQLTAQLHLNKIRTEEMSNLKHEIQKRNINREMCLADLCSMQYVTVNNLRTLSKQAATLESDANRVLSARKSIVDLARVPRVYLTAEDTDDESSI
ncbi:hypothetical protein OESDEN_24708 [Oesophagostomum dentatum]|uniref:Uncharacterized protein n=1 Tax=Oesophagostomum dentatum TaxID=61180 RepID=A0A0B1RVM5_OESDE|nr:hypothetical protein OESDEN_24708 [Oesophagostomum dentatum]